MLRYRVTSLWRTITEPWRSPGLILGVIGAFTIGTALVTSGALYGEAAVNKVAAAGMEPVSLLTAGLDLRIEAAVNPERFADLDGAIRDRIATSGYLGDPALTLYSSADGTVGLVDGVGDGRRLRLLSRDGALAAIDPVSSDPSIDGAWISESFAGRMDTDVGDTLVITNNVFLVELPIAGVYADVFPADPSDYWSEFPADLVPLYFPLTGTVNTETVIVSREVMLDSGAVSWMRWQAPLATRPDTLAQVRAAERVVATFDSSLIRSEADLLTAVTGSPDPVMTTLSDLPDVRSEVDRAAASLSEPLTTIRWAGVALGLAIVAAAATFASTLNAGIFRVLLSDGDSPARVGVRTAAQLAIPAVFGSILGVALAFAVVAWLGPEASFSFGSVDPQTVLTVAATGLVLVATVTSMLAIDRAFPRAEHPRPLAVDLAVLALAGAAWYQVATSPPDSSGRVDLLVVMYPIVGLAAAVLLVMRAFDIVARRFAIVGRRLPVPLFLAWRRLTSSQSTSRTLTGAVALSLGMIVFASTIVPALEAGLETKSAALIGGVSSANILGNTFPTTADPQTTVLWTKTARIRTENQNVRLIGIDEATFGQGVSWSDRYGLDIDEVIERLNRQGNGTDIPMLAVGSVPADGVASSQTGSVAFTIVGRLESFPLVSTQGPTLVFSADRLRSDQRALFEDRIRDQNPDATDLTPFEGQWVDPIESFNETVVSQRSAAETRQLLASWQVTDRNLVSTAEILESPEGQAGILAFGYFRILAGAGIVAAGAALLLSLSQQQERRHLAYAMSRRMGLSQAGNLAALGAELLGLIGLATLTAYFTAVWLTRRILPQFDPLPAVPPDVGLSIATWLPIGLTAATLIIVLAASVFAHAGAVRAEEGGVLRGLA